MAFVVLTLRAHRVRQEARVRPQHMVIILAALTAELDWSKQAPTTRLHLTFQRELTSVRSFQCGEECASLADKLVQFEGECSPTVFAYERPAHSQEFTQARCTHRRPHVSFLCQPLSGLRQRARDAALEPLSLLRLHAEFSFHPTRANGWRRKSSSWFGSKPVIAATNSSRVGSSPSVKVTSVSSMTCSAVKGCPNNRKANSATVARCDSGVASELATIVALVPTCPRLGAAQRSFNRRMSMATSAPWRPR